MPKTTKRAATRKAARIAKAHATELPKLQVKEAPRRAPGYKPPARGIARYPWGATILTILIIGLGIWTIYFYHVGPFALPASNHHAVVKPNLKLPNPSPCVSSTIIKQITDTAPGPSATAFKNTQHTYSKAPAMSINVNKFYCVGLNTNRGLIVLELDPQYAPVTVNNFVFLAEHHFYDGMVFHRVIQTGNGIHIIQTGDPTGTGTGGPGYKFKDEPVLGSYTAGCVAMANAGPNTNGSQFFICTGDDSKLLAKSYNLFGRVVQGLNIAQKIQGPGDDPSTKNIKPDVLEHVIVVQAP
ncbi:MAG TPA: peptidylprolyl isomerase [Ktedonobacteraceae bacterium]|jgi:cyclophilin family peptidyl-prolyl cis-trans isomerase|nr:peptidylprolyl isomerase [Ktedonobacteraceae bacterium]